MGAGNAAPLSRKSLHPWQENAVVRASSSRLALCALIGAGKTVTALTTLVQWAKDVKGANPSRVRPRFLLVAPSAVLDSTWVSEAARWEHTQHLTFALTHQMTGAARARAWREADVDVMTCTPDLLHVFLEVFREDRGLSIDGLIVDEVHMFRNPDSRRAQALLSLCRSSNKRVLLMTGSPCPNGVQNLYVMGCVLSHFDTKFWGTSYNSFLGARFVPQGDFSVRPKSGQIDEINREFGRYAISIGDMRPPGVPEPIGYTHRFDHPDSLVKIIRDFTEKREGVAGGIKLDGATDGAFLAKLSQLGQGFVYADTGVEVVLSDARVDALARVVDAIDTPVLIACRYRADASAILRRYPGARVFSGETPRDERLSIIEQWNRGEISMLIGSPAAMATGLNLQHGPCRDLVWFSHVWDASLRAQFEGRLVRQGQKHRIRIHDLVCTVGLDESILTVLARKGSGEQELLAQLKVSASVGNQNNKKDVEVCVGS